MYLYRNSAAKTLNAVQLVGMSASMEVEQSEGKEGTWGLLEAAPAPSLTPLKKGRDVRGLGAEGGDQPSHPTASPHGPPVLLAQRGDLRAVVVEHVRPAPRLASGLLVSSGCQSIWTHVN